MSGTSALLVFILLAAQAIPSVVHAGAWKSQWGTLFPEPAATSESKNPAPGTAGLQAFQKSLSEKRVRMSYEILDSLPAGQELRIDADFSENRLGFRVSVSRALSADPIRLAVRLHPLLAHLRSFPLRQETLSWMELWSNALAGSAAAKERLLLLDERYLQWEKVIQEPLIEAMMKESGGTREEVLARFEELRALEIERVTEELKLVRTDAQLRASAAEKAWNDWKKETGAFEKMEAMELKLNDLIVRNDRQGVRRLIEAYLPWPLMEPREVNAWKNWLDAIEKPRWDRTTVAFRGVDYGTDFVQSMRTPDGDIKIGFMSTLLTKNQGNYTRRLRSLATRRLQNGTVSSMDLPRGISPYTQISDQMRRHAGNPVGSVFLSFTPSPAVAYGFIGESKTDANGRSVARGGLLAVRMDSRRLIPNLPSPHVAEYELLTPLIVFPDEVLVYRESLKSGDPTFFDLFLRDVSHRTGMTFPREFGVISPEALETFHKEGFEFWRETEAESVKIRSCSKVFS